MAGNPYTESARRSRSPTCWPTAPTRTTSATCSAGKDAFALSYVENALTSNPTLAPLGDRDPRRLQARAHGPGRGGADHRAVARLLGGGARGDPRGAAPPVRGAATLLKVNAEYIRSAAQADAYRTEPPFKLQGSYRNMNKIAEKVVAAMTPTSSSASSTTTTAASRRP
jgi:hypothetical protein